MKNKNYITSFLIIIALVSLSPFEASAQYDWDQDPPKPRLTGEAAVQAALQSRYDNLNWDQKANILARYFAPIDQEYRERGWNVAGADSRVGNPGTVEIIKVHLMSTYGEEIRKEAFGPANPTEQLNALVTSCAKKDQEDQNYKYQGSDL